MRILKSGIEMTPEELSKAKGAHECACGCEGGYNSQQLWVSGKEEYGCLCGCTTTDAWTRPLTSAEFYPY